MKYKIAYYNADVEKLIMQLPKTLVVRYIRITQLMTEFGSNLGMPHTKSIGDSLFEIRLKGQEGIARVFYCTVVNKSIVMLHSFIKKTDKIPSKELEIAIKRKKEIRND